LKSRQGRSPTIKSTMRKSSDHISSVT
jgi:hypothetical protein